MLFLKLESAAPLLDLVHEHCHVAIESGGPTNTPSLILAEAEKYCMNIYQLELERYVGNFKFFAAVIM